MGRIQNNKNNKSSVFLELLSMTNTVLCFDIAAKLFGFYAKFTCYMKPFTLDLLRICDKLNFHKLFCPQLMNN